jgi:hypothetical protein
MLADLEAALAHDPELRRALNHDTPADPDNPTIADLERWLGDQHNSSN